MRTAIAVLAVAFATTSFAQQQEPINADRPGIADGSQTVGRGVFQVELGGERDHFTDGDVHVLSTPLLLRYGLTAPLELRVEGNGWARVTAPGFHTSGWTPASIGAKFHFLDKPSLGVIARWFPPSGTGDFKSDHASADLRLAADVDLSEAWSLNPNIGVASQDDGDGRFTSALAALTLQYNVSKTFNVFVDGGLQSPESKGGSAALILDTGAAWIVGNNTQLDVEAGWGARGQSPPNVFVGAGISHRF
ncbi:MAG TPA: transporter [Thermoanaerobaculia bacterium]|nr:transporter [Thermoanaerobaculia bacterium]